MSELKFLVVTAAILLTMTTAVWVASSYFEAQSFNRLTGHHVSTWDAMFVDLRVQESPK